MCFDSVVVRAACLGIHALDGTVVDRIKLRAKMAAAVSPVNATAAVACIYSILFTDRVRLDRGLYSVLWYITCRLSQQTTWRERAWVLHK